MDKENKKDGFMDKVKQIDDKIIDKAKEIDTKVDQSIDKGVKRTKSFFRKFMIGVLILGIISIIGYFLWAGYVYSDGRRSGELVKFSHKGFPFKTYEGQLKLGGIDMEKAQEGTISDTWDFSVTDKEVVKQLEELQGQDVLLYYEQIMKPMPWQGDTKYFIRKVEKK